MGAWVARCVATGGVTGRRVVNDNDRRGARSAFGCGDVHLASGNGDVDGACPPRGRTWPTDVVGLAYQTRAWLAHVLAQFGRFRSAHHARLDLAQRLASR